MIKFSIFLWVCFALDTTRVDSQSATQPTIRPVDLESFSDNVTAIGSLSNSSWNLVGKCCNIGQVFRQQTEEDEEMKCQDLLPEEKIEYSPLFHSFNESGVFAPGTTSSRFVAVVGNPCRQGKYMLEPGFEDSIYYLLVNGSVFRPYDVPIILHPGQDYCMEFIPGQGLAVMVCYEQALVTADTRLAFYTSGLLISVPFLLATIVSYLITPQLRDTMGLNLCCYVGSLAVAFLSLAVLQLSGDSLVDNACIGLGFLIELSFLASFVWFNAMAIETWLLIRRYAALGSTVRNGRPHPNPCFFYYSLWGWGLPALVIVLSLALNLIPTIPWSYKQFGCLFEDSRKSLPYFYVPVGILVLLNAAIFTITGLKIARIQRDLDVQRLARNEEMDRINRRVFSKLRLTFFYTLLLFIIMAINWSMELVSMMTESNMLAWSVFDFVNALQGVLVFGLFVLRSDVRPLVWHRVKQIIGVANRGSESSSERPNESTLLPILSNSASSRLTQ